MKEEFKFQEIGKVLVDANMLTGVVNVYKEGKKLNKISRSEYVYDDEDETKSVYVVGNIYKGIYVASGEETFTFFERTPFYIYALSIIPLLMTIILGNMQSLVEKGFYYVGGAIGGVIGAVFGFLIIWVSGLTKKPIVKILFALLLIIASFILCLGIGNLIVYVLTH